MQLQYFRVHSLNMKFSSNSYCWVWAFGRLSIEHAGITSYTQYIFVTIGSKGHQIPYQIFIYEMDENAEMISWQMIIWLFEKIVSFCETMSINETGTFEFYRFYVLFIFSWLGAFGVYWNRGLGKINDHILIPYCSRFTWVNGRHMFHNCIVFISIFSQRLRLKSCKHCHRVLFRS